MTKAAPGVGRPGKSPQRREHPELKAALAKWGLSGNETRINLSFEVNGDADVPLVCALMTLQSVTRLDLGEYFVFAAAVDVFGLPFWSAAATPRYAPDQLCH